MGIKIIFVDDEPNIREVVELYLRRDGFEVEVAADGEAALVQLVPQALKSSVLIAPHHGSKSSSTKGFVKRVSPEVVVISAGWRNRFKFPHPGVLERYKQQGSVIYRTDVNGAVYLTSDGQNLDVRTTVARPSNPI